jgi:3-methyladenine DNA glycosylase AlkD
VSGDLTSGASGVGVGNASDVKAALAAVAVAGDIPNLQRFFKTGPGQYGEGDVFIGIRVPVTRQVIKGFADLPIEEIEDLLDSEVHEHRLAALLILVGQFDRASKRALRRDDRYADRTRAELVDFYLSAVRRGRVNNWDLVDATAGFILGEYLVDRPRDLLFELAASENLWERRVAIITTQGLIGHGDASSTLEIATLLLDDRRDLIQKAVGWMLREVGKRVDRALLVEFLELHAAAMGRTSLSYATEHLSAEVILRYRSAS